MKRLLIYTGLGNTLTAVLVSAAVYFFSPVHPLGQFRLLLGVVTLAWLIAGIRSLKYKVQAGDLKVTHGLLFSAGSGLVAAVSFGLVVWLLGTLNPVFWNDYLADQLQNLGMASGLLETNYSPGTLANNQLFARYPGKASGSNSKPNPRNLGPAIKFFSMGLAFVGRGLGFRLFSYIALT
jgi:hypothetical protein